MKDSRLDNVEIEWAPWTPETWERAVNSLAATLAEIEEDQSQGANNVERIEP